MPGAPRPARTGTEAVHVVGRHANRVTFFRVHVLLLLFHSIHSIESF